MSSDRIIVDALKLAHSLLWQNLRPDAPTVLQLRALVDSPSVRLALERGSDTVPAFALREIACVLSNQSQTHGETILRIRIVLDDMKEALGLGQNRRTISGPHPSRRWWE
jgi:hypothetical protein